MDGIRRLIGEGHYRSVQDFLFAAAHNQLYDLEQTSGAAPADASITSLSRIKKSTILAMPSPQYQLLAPDVGEVNTNALPEPDRIGSEIFGLWNRFFPVKITTRVLANMLKGDGSSVPLDKLQENASTVARELGRMLLRKERDLGRKRSDMVATALPTKGGVQAEYKAKARFKSHFVGFLSKDRIEGAPATLRFVNIWKGDSDILVGLTSPGLKFTSLTNPIIDRDDFSSALSDEERRFLIDHISTELPQEMKLIRFVIEAVKRGAVHPEALQEEIKKLKPELKENELVIARSGLLGRMSELKLVTRTRNGLSVSYKVTPDAELLLS